MLCWSCVIADMQSANCRPKKATTANTTNSLLPIMLVRLYVDWMPESTKGYIDHLRGRKPEPTSCKDRIKHSGPTEGALNRDTLAVLWVQVWVQLKREKWLPISRKRHQIGHLDFRSFRLLTEMLEVRILPGEPTPFSCRELRTFSGNS